MWSLLITYVLPVVLVAGYAALCWAIGESARRRGLSQAGFTLLSVFATPLVGYLVVAIITSDPRSQDIRRGQLARCPACAEWIQPAAVKCRYCGQAIQRAAPRPVAVSRAAGAAPAPGAVPPPAPKPAVAAGASSVSAPPPRPMPSMQPPPPPPKPAPAPAAVPPAAVTQPEVKAAQEEIPVDAEAVQLADKIEAMRHQPAAQHPPGFYEKTHEWLRHEAPPVRRAAAHYLARHCRQHADAEALLDMVVHDSEASVRATAAECLGGIFRQSRNREANDVLAAVTRDRQEEGAVRAAALAAIKRINGSSL